MMTQELTIKLVLANDAEVAVKRSTDAERVTYALQVGKCLVAIKADELSALQVAITSIQVTP